MKVFMINGSSRRDGNTSIALHEVAKTLQTHGIETEIAWIGNKPIRGCTACRTCANKGNNRCVFDDDVVNSLIEKAAEADGYVFGTPVYFAGANGSLISLLDRMFYAGGAPMKGKPGVGIGVARRAGTIQAADEINKYFQINAMPVVSSTYWGLAYGREKGQASEDAEGMKTMANIGHQMAWLLKCIQAGKDAGIELELEAPVFTHFIR